ncbi:MAG: hypothetical protein QG608_819 [Actinomycetota bacterium]|nr:hypothetical protein [Actinomycetota bacterium]
MTDPPGPIPPTANVAGDRATVGVQAQNLHGDVTIYQVPPGATPRKKYEIGVNHLQGRMPDTARRLITDAIENGFLDNEDEHLSSEIGFHWALAILSGRTLRQLSDEEFDHLQVALGTANPHSADRWTEGLQLIGLLLGVGQKNDFDLVDEKFEKLDDEPHDKILTHLELVLESQNQDRMWERSVRRAHEERLSSDRTERVGLFFEPVPAPARMMPVEPLGTTFPEYLGTVASTLVALLPVWHLGGTAVQAGGSRTGLALFLTVLAGVCCARKGAELRFGKQRIRQKDLEFDTTRNLTGHATETGFARGVERLADKYFARYVPRGLDRDLWLKLTTGVRCRTRDNIAETYRETAIRHDQIAWLMRARASAAERQWETRTFQQYRQQLSPTGSAVLWFFLTSAGAVIGGLHVVTEAIRSRPMDSTWMTLLLLGAGLFAVRGWAQIDLERRRFAADTQEARHLLSADTEAYLRWKEKLKRRPDDREMADWLDCDRKILMYEATEHYKMLPGETIAHAFIEAPGEHYKRNRVPDGPWRYSRYHIILFLLTEDGVRQVDADLDFKKGILDIRQRMSYRFDAVSSVKATQKNRIPQKFVLTLVNGTPVDVPVRGQFPPEQDLRNVPDPPAEEDAASGVSSDAAGLRRTLHIFEGVAAEGKEWVENERKRGTTRVAALTERLAP